MVYLVGADGYVGRAFAAFFEQKAVPFRRLTRADGDFSNKDFVASLLGESRPSLVLNAAGYVGRPTVDATELHKLRTLQENTILPAVLAEVCAEKKIPLGHVSSGCIFSGNRADGNPFNELDPPNITFGSSRQSFYSGSKALAEEILRKTPNCYVWRLRYPFNSEDGPRNYISKLMRYEKLIDARNSLSQLDEFVEACWHCVTVGAAPGIYNVTNPGSVRTSWIVDRLLALGITDKSFQYFRSEEEFCDTVLIPRAFCTLDSSKILATGAKLTPVQEAIETALAYWQRES